MEATESDDEFICSKCVSPAAGFCCCDNNKVKLCISCFAEHYHRDESLSHTFLPLEAYDYISPLVPIADFLERRRVVTTILQSMHGRIQRLTDDREDYVKYLSAKEDEMIRMVQEQVALDKADACERINKEIKNLQVIITAIEKARGDLELGEELPHLMIRGHEIAGTSLLSDTTKFKVEIGAIRTELAKITRLLVYSFEDYFRNALAASKVFHFSFNSNIMSTYEPKSNLQQSHTLMGGKNIPEKACWCSLQSGLIFVCGGYFNNTYQSETLIVDPTYLTLANREPMTQARRSHGLIEYGGCVYAFGGFNGALLSTAERYNLKGENWEKIANMKMPRNFVMPALMKDLIYIVGYDGNTMEVYNPKEDEFRLLEFSMPVSNAYTAVLGCPAALIILQTTNVFLCDTDEAGQLHVIKSSVISKNAGWFTYGAPIFQSGKFFFYNYADSSYYSVRQHNKTVKVRMLLTTSQ